jgi:CubicO group peptidase (beta-lactamase class C family)
MRLTRRDFTALTLKSAALSAASRFMALDAFAQPNSRYQAVFQSLDQFVEQYMRDMNAPGMTFTMADRDGVQRVTTYGFSDFDQKIAPTPVNLFQIGSISKSFVAICLLQLRDEGKLVLQRPVTDYLPWFRIDSSFAPITTHHLLTHSSGLPSIPNVFLSDPAARHRAAYAPGQYFHYCNMGYSALGHLLETLDGKPIGESLRARIFQPLGMTQSEPVINLDARARFAKNYAAFQNDRPYPRYGALAEAPAIVITDGAGCIASTPRDMGLYVQMLAYGGKTVSGRLLSEESFALFAQPHIKAEEFGPTASYGYGIAVDTLDGHKLLRHTGGMVSFASALQVDVDEGVGAFASINAMQGYRPNPVVQYALQLMRAQRNGKALPAAPRTVSPWVVENAGDYAGSYQNSDGRTLEIVAEEKKIILNYNRVRVPMEAAMGSPDTFVVLHSDFERFPLVFQRSDDKDPKSPVVEAVWGPDWYLGSKYSGPRDFPYPKEWDGYTGHYRNESPWLASTRVLIRKGKLWLDGVTPLEEGTGGMFYLRDDEHSPEWVQFFDVVNGKAMRLKLSGEDLWRVMTA